MSFDQAGTKAAIAALTKSGSLLVSEREGEVVGAVGLVATPHPFHQGLKLAAQVFWWVEPDQPEAETELLGAAEQWARDQGCQILTMIAAAGLRGTEMKDMFCQHGFSPMEQAFIKTLFPEDERGETEWTSCRQH